MKHTHSRPIDDYNDNDAKLFRRHQRRMANSMIKFGIPKNNIKIA